MTTQEKILEAKKLLEQYAPQGEFLAYISRDEAKTLKDLGGSGIIIEETGIPSFNPFANYRSSNGCYICTVLYGKYETDEKYAYGCRMG